MLNSINNKSAIGQSEIWIPWLQNVEPEIARTISESFQLIELSKNQKLIEQGELNQIVAVIKTGSLYAQQRSIKGRRHILAIYVVSQSIGLTSLFLKSPANHTIVAAEDSLLIAIPCNTFEKQLEISNTLLMNISQSVSIQSEKWLQAISCQKIIDPLVRLAQTLIILAEDFCLATISNGRECLSINLSQNIISEMMGISRAKINIELKELESMMLIKIGYARITILDKGKLSDLGSLHF